MRHLPRMKHWPEVKIGHLHHFHVFFHYISSVLGGFTDLYCDTSSLAVRSTPTWEVKPPLFSHISNICNSCKYIIEGSGKSPALQHFINYFLSDITVKIFINFWHYFFWMCQKIFFLLLFVWLTSSVFSKWKVLMWWTYLANFTDMGSAVLQF